MGNILTNQLCLVEKQSVPSAFPFMGRTLKPQSNWYQVVFRGDIWLGTVAPTTKPEATPFKIHANDITLRVVDLSRLYTLTGTIATKDKYKRAYEIPLFIKVKDPKLVAIAYFQEKDPAQQALDRIKALLEHYASGIDHDRITMVDFPFASWSMSALQDTGITIEQYGKILFRQDPNKTQEQIQEQEAKQRRKDLEREAELQSLKEKNAQQQESQRLENQRIEQTKQKDFERREKTKDQLFDICKNLRQVAAEEITNALRERINENFARGYTPSQMSGEFFALIGVFDEQTHLNLQESMIAGLYIEGDLIDPIDIDEDEDDNVPSASSSKA